MRLACAYPGVAPVTPEDGGLALGLGPLTPSSDAWLRVDEAPIQGEWPGLQWDDGTLSFDPQEPYALGIGPVEPDPAVSPAEGAGSPFAALSRYLGEKWATEEQGLDAVDALCKSFADGLLGGEPHPFIHARALEAESRHPYLAPLPAIAQIFALRASGSEDVLRGATEAQLQKIQVNVCVPCRN